MYTDDDIESAVEAGILTDDSAAAFRGHVSERRDAPIMDDEHFRFISGGLVSVRRRMVGEDFIAVGGRHA